MTKSELLARVAELEAEVARLSPDSEVREHLELLNRALVPYLERLARLPEAEAAMSEAWDAEGAKAALLVLGSVRLSAQEVTAMNGLLRQIAEVKGLLLRRRLHGAGRKAAEDVVPAAEAPARVNLPLGKLSNVVRLGAGRARG
jgi:hypothetical protein